MSKLQFNPKLVICQYFDKIVNLIDIHTEEQLSKYPESEMIGEPFKFEFIELSNLIRSRENEDYCKYLDQNDVETLKYRNEYSAEYDLSNHPKKEIEPGSVRVRDYLSTTRDELITLVKNYEAQALSRYQEIKDDLLKSIQVIDDRDTQIEEFKKRLFAKQHVGVFKIEKIVYIPGEAQALVEDVGENESEDEMDVDFEQDINDADMIFQRQRRRFAKIKHNKSPFKLYLVVLDFYFDRNNQDFLSYMNREIKGFLHFSENQAFRVKKPTNKRSRKTLDKRKFRTTALKKYILSLAEHQKYLRVMDIKEEDLFNVDEVCQKVKPFYNKIDLGHNEEDDESDIFKLVKSLEVLSVENMKYKVQLQSLSSFTNLRSLLLNHANLTDNALQGLSSLVTLNLYNCKFDNFKSKSFRHVPNLEFLYFNFPSYYFSINFGELNRLKWLKISSAYNSSFHESLSLNKELHTLVIADINSNESEFFTKLTHQNLKTLELEFDSLDKFDGKWLAGVPNLRNLAFSNMFIDPDKLVIIDIDLSSLNSLESLYFQRIEFPSFDFILTGLTNLKCLFLNKCNLTINTETFKGTSNLKSLRMTEMKTSERFNIAANSFQYLANLTELDLSNNNINSLDLELFSYVPKLETLNLKGNQLGFSPSMFVHLKELKNLTLNGI